MSKIEDFRLLCGFCGEKKSFSSLDQVPLRIDKNAKHQMLFDNRCVECTRENTKHNINGQQIRVFTGRSRHIDEQTVFDEKDGSDNI